VFTRRRTKSCSKGEKKYEEDILITGQKNKIADVGGWGGNLKAQDEGEVSRVRVRSLRTGERRRPQLSRRQKRGKDQRGECT